MKKIESYVTDITWERIHMFVKIRLDGSENVSENLQFFLVNEEYLVETEFEILEKQDNEYLLTLNVTNNGENRCVCNGTYTIIMADKGRYISEVGYTGTSKGLEGWGRCFRYLNNKGAYTVTCLLDEYSEESRFQLLFYNTVQRAMGHPVDMPAPRTMEGVPVHFEIAKPENKYVTKIKNKKLAVANLIRRKSYDIFNRMYHGKGKKKTILFLSEQDDKPALNMQVLLDRMAERGIDKEYNIIHSFRKATSEDQSMYSNLKMLKAVSSADLIVVDDHVPLFDKIALKNNTKMIQIWHAGAGFKGVGYSRWGHYGCPGPYSCHRQYDFCISGSSNISEFFSEQFGILDEQIIPTGMPRMDLYLNKENRVKVTEELYKRFPEAKGRKVILFAPTYRGQNRATAYYPYEILDFQALYDFCVEKDYVVFFKMHPWVSAGVPIEKEHSDRFYDLNSYPNINDLFYITDLLVTDYSSSIYEFSLMDKPMMFFAYDKVQYSASRGFHRDYDTVVPGKICETFEAVMEALWMNDLEFEKVKKYREDHFDFVDDHSADRIIDWLILGNLPEEYKQKLDEKRRKVKAARGLSFREYYLEDAQNEK